MTNQPAELGRTVTQLGDDVAFIYDKLDGLEGRHRRFARETHTRFDTIEAHLADHDARFDQIDHTLAEVLRRLPEAGDQP